jgi:hypothetical protein
MANYKVVFEIEVDAETALEAAKIVQDWLQNPSDSWQFYVMNEDTQKVYSVDLDEHESVAVIDVERYLPLIR